MTAAERGTGHEAVLFADTAPQSVHCAALAEVAPGELLAVAYAFSYETSPDSRLVASRFVDGAWTPSRTLVDPPGVPVGNPVIAAGKGGRLHLWYVALHGETWREGRIVHAASDDGGRSWRGHAPVHARAGLMTKARPVELDAAALLPVYDERLWCSHVLVADDLRGPWRLHGDTTARGATIQPVVAPLPGGRLLMLSRSSQGSVYRSISVDGGRSWTASQPTALPNPNAGIDLLALPGGDLLLAFNPDAHGRERIAVARSSDAGRSWSAPHVLEQVDGELSYPFLLRTAAGQVHLVYTQQRTRIVHRTLDAGILEALR